METASESVAAGSQSEGKGLLPECSPPPPEAPSPPSPGTPATQTAEERVRARESKDSQIAELIAKLEKLQATGLPPPPEPPAPDPANLFLSPPLNCAAPWGRRLGEMGRGERGPGARRRGIVRDALVEGVLLPTVYPTLIDKQGGRVWEALNWKVLKEAKGVVTQYGLKSPYTHSVIQHIFSATLLTPYDTRMLVRMLLSPLQQLQFFQHWQQSCDSVAATPRQQGDPLCGVQSQMLLGTGPFVRPEWQAQFAPEVLQLS